MKNCELCGNTMPVALQSHHLKPKHNGGGNESTNRLTVCANCHCVLTSVMGKLNGNTPRPKDIRHVAKMLYRFAAIVDERSKAVVK